MSLLLFYCRQPQNCTRKSVCFVIKALKNSLLLYYTGFCNVPLCAVLGLGRETILKGLIYRCICGSLLFFSCAVSGQGPCCNKNLMFFAFQWIYQHLCRSTTVFLALILQSSWPLWLCYHLHWVLNIPSSLGNIYAAVLLQATSESCE